MASDFAKDKEASFDLQTQSMNFSMFISKRNFFMAQIMLRVFAAVFTLVAVCIMVTSSQSIILLGFPYKAHYSYSSAMRFLLVADAMVCAFSVLSLIFVYSLKRSSGSNLKNCFYLFMHDMMIMVLAISGCAAATAAGYISRYGEEKMGWMAVCNRVEKFCNQMTIAMVLSYLAFFSYFALAVMSSNKVMYQANE